MESELCIEIFHYGQQALGEQSAGLTCKSRSTSSNEMRLIARFITLISILLSPGAVLSVV